MFIGKQLKHSGVSEAEMVETEITDLLDVVSTGEDVPTLLERTLQVLPVDDTLSFFQRINHVHWEEVNNEFIVLLLIVSCMIESFILQVKFKSYSEEDCKSHVFCIGKHQRQHRVMSEILKDMVHEVWTEQEDLILLEHIRRVVPKIDTAHFYKQLKSINGEKVS